MPKRKSEAQICMESALRELGLRFETEYRFAPPRKWRFDYACCVGTNIPLAIEIHGGVFISGHHTRGQGFEDDREKMNHAQVLGWDVLEFTTNQVLRGHARQTIRGWLEEHKTAQNG